MVGACLGGCTSSSLSCPRVIYLDGADWMLGSGKVRTGLQEAGYPGQVERFNWSTVVLGPVADHILAQKIHPRVGALANRITEVRHANPDGQIVLMALSAGTKLVVNALEKLPADVSVDYVVLLSPSLSGQHDLSDALMHVKYRLYATSSPHDSMLEIGSSAGFEGGAPAGQSGFTIPANLGPGRRHLYDKVVNLPWQPGYEAYGWNGGHISVTDSEFIRTVIAPRIMDNQPHPLDLVARED